MNDPDYSSVKERYTMWRNHLLSMGFGRSLNSDLPYEVKGSLPSADFFDKIYGAGHWNAMTIRSLSIGQGEITVTPLQLVNYATMVANRGWYYPPHIVRAIGTEKNFTDFTRKKVYITVDQANVEVVRKGMEEVVQMGTARAVKIDSIPMAGKTGTADNPHGKPHSIFIGFAPIDNPKIAICVVVENAGFGSTYAAPIASLMVEKYITRKIARTELKDRMLNINLLNN